jgi:hypothetical protein
LDRKWLIGLFIKALVSFIYDFIFNNYHFLVVHSRSQAVGMWQALLEEGAIAHGRKLVFFLIFLFI